MLNYESYQRRASWDYWTVLQVITGMYFRDVRLNETEHRRTLYTNANFVLHQRVDFPVGHVVTSTEWSAINTVLAHFTERLEAVRPDGKDDFMISTGGDAIADDLAVVLSFALNATFTPIRAKADRLISEPSGSYHSPEPADILLRTFGPNLMLRDDDVKDLQNFMGELLALNRGEYEAAMRAMRRIVTASERVAEDPTLAYTDYVAALETLSAGFNVARPTWDRLDPRKRRILDPVLNSLTPTDAARTRAAILESERAGIKNRYVEFVLDHVRPSYYREEATGLNRPAQQPSLRQVVAKAYDARSKNLHELRELSTGTWLLVGSAETVTPPGETLMLTHEGLNRLARHVVRTYVQRGSTERDTDYKWRDHLPNVIQVQLSPEFYLGHADAMHPRTAATRAGEFLSHAIEAISGRGEFTIDMRPALTRIEKLLATQRSPSVREPMLAVYLLWHLLLPPEVHQPDPGATLDVARDELHRPSLYSFAVALLLDLKPSWDVDQWCELAEQRYEELHSRRPVEFPARFDSALWLYVAEVLQREGARHAAQAALARAIECTPGHEELLSLERQAATGDTISPDVRDFLIGSSPDEDQSAES
ncbi:hypothetical protein [Kribbia dieselivorans]|uniref:hypothetical protein n=1 Tax=Kribbia dieselivorans TaxID=331526 RepID=UPI0008388375|nr:hypothetical protein [Kribbia dieselivorans]